MNNVHPDDLMPPLDYACLAPASLIEPPTVNVVPGAASHLQVPYAECHGWRPLRLDLHVPTGDVGPFPVVVYVHGGSFLTGTPAIGPWRSLPGRGIAVASASYRFSGEAGFPEPVEDIRAAVAWVRTNASRFSLDAERVALWGSSAGGYLAAVTAVAGTRQLGHQLRLFNGVRPDPANWAVSAAVLHYPVTAPELLRADAFDSSEQEIEAMEAVMRNFFGSDPQLPTAVADQVDDPASLPLFFLAHGDTDRRVGVGQSERLVQALAEVGAQVELHVIPGGDHGSAHFEADEHLDEVETFLRRAWTADEPG